jgi:hypothetical protein
MPTHDIIDNRNEKLVDHINRILSSTEARGRQELFTRQSPQKLKALRERALIESAITT